MGIMKFVVLSIISEALWEGTKIFWQNGKLNIDRVGAFIFSEVLCLTTGMDFLKALDINVNVPYLGIIFTGFLISRGSNFMHDLICSTTIIKENIKK
ncbi:hypothetical protein LAV35_14385 [Clostridium sporogenes]|uniref:hypothetical protein n=1 Tax=Clostridium sporogenes TaxID=1509 RepID=UPI0013D11C24|nr:hypothetical protein [Clostridium sporogenes]MBA4509991.1 hypothetical protein [Clostridium sporogenes]MCW6060692.1 hypothetical protein [Clostridium sporogenes]MCW6069362.1 hypothetical protein [Clostridium sporogenes]MDU6336899.1 hypothetical protein [Clostridium sporogenes]NFQ86270.1 hypothetical protein [Clostridium sporogenes]